MTTFTPDFALQLDAYRSNFTRLAEEAAAAGYDRSAQVQPAMTAAAHFDAAARAAGVEDVSRLLSSPNAPRLAALGVRDGKPVVIKAEVGDDLGEAVLLRAYAAWSMPAVEVVAADVLPTSDGPLRFIATVLAGDGTSLGRRLGTVETSPEQTRAMLRLAAALQFPPGTRVEGVHRTAQAHLNASFAEADKLLRAAGMLPARPLHVTARTFLGRIDGICHGDFNANNVVPRSNPTEPELTALDPPALLGPRELSAAEAIAQSQLLGPECDRLLDDAAATDPSLDGARLRLGVGAFHGMYAGYCIGNLDLWRADPDRYRRPTHDPADLLASSNDLVLRSGLVPDRALGLDRPQRPQGPLGMR